MSAWISFGARRAAPEISRHIPQLVGTNYEDTIQVLNAQQPTRRVPGSGWSNRRSAPGPPSRARETRRIRDCNGCDPIP